MFCTSVAFASEVTLLWDANTEPDLAGYKAYYKVVDIGDPGGTPYDGTGAIEGASPVVVWLNGLKSSGPEYANDLELSDNANPEVTLTGLDPSKTYYFVVTAFDDETPPLESDISNEVSVEGLIVDVDTDGDGIPDNVDTDDDNDGLPDVWEALYGLDPLFNDAAIDTDGDILTNLQEYTIGFNPIVSDIPDRPSNVLIYLGE